MPALFRVKNRRGKMHNNRAEEIKKFTYLQLFYNEHYLWLEGLGCAFLPLAIAGLILQMPFPSRVYLFLFAVLLLSGTIWAFYFTSLLGKTAFFISLIAGLIFHLDGNPTIVLTLILAVVFLVIIRLLLLFCPMGKGILQKWLSFLELVNRRLAAHEISPDQLISSYNQDVLLRKVAAGNWDVNRYDEEGRNLLLLAVEKGDQALTGKLLDLGANPNLYGKGGYEEFTPLLLAVEKQYIAMTESLLEKGVDPCDKPGESTAVKKAVLSGNYFLLLTLLNYINKEKLGKKEIDKPSLKIFYSHAPFPIEESNLSAPKALDLYANYLWLLKQETAYWMKIFEQLFSQKDHIYDQDPGYLILVSTGTFKFELTKKSRITESAEETVSFHRGLLRAGDQLEDKLEEQFSLDLTGQFTFPSNCQAVPCEDCDGKGEIICPSGCEQGLIKCNATDCLAGKIKCSTCQGKGHVEQICPDCQKGVQNCQYCRGKGFLRCETCEGEGYLLVQNSPLKCTCPADKKILCPICQGTGKSNGYICMHCAGEGIICKYCGFVDKADKELSEGLKGEKLAGKGYANKQGKEKQGEFLPCSTCDGTGLKEKCSCSRGKVICETCQGNGELVSRCSDCDGGGFLYCSRCGGKGTERCNRCAGKGWASCVSCKGKGKFYRLTDTIVNYYRVDPTKDETFIYLPDKIRTQGNFMGIPAEYLLSRLKGEYDLYRIFMAEGDQKIKSRSSQHSPLLQNINNQLTIKSSDDRRTLKKIIDIMVLKYDIIYLYGGAELVVIEERDSLTPEYKKVE